MARDRYLWNSGEEAINNPDAEIKLDTRKSKWDNFWYYHKWHVVISIIACVVVGVFAYDVLTKVKPDYQIAVMTQKSYPSATLDALGNELGKFGKDLNGDGKVSVQVNSYVMVYDDPTDAPAESAVWTPETQMPAQTQDPNIQMASVTRYTVDLQSGDSMIFLTDKQSFEDQWGNARLFSYLDGTLPKEDATDFENMRIPWQDCKGLTSLEFIQDDMAIPASKIQELFDELSVSMRYIEGTAIDNKADKVIYYNESREMFEKLLNGVSETTEPDNTIHQ